MSTLTLNDIAYRVAKHGRITRDEPRQEELDLIVANVRQLVAQEAAAPAEQVVGDGVADTKWPGPWNGHRFPVDAIAKVFGEAAFEAFSVLRLGAPNHVEIGIALLRHLGSAGFGVCRDTPRRTVAAPDLSDRYRAVMEAQGGVTDEMVDRACHAYYNCGHPVWPPVFEGMRAALQKIAERHSDKSVDGQIARDALAAHPLTGHSAVPEGSTVLSEEGASLIARAIGAHGAVVRFLVDGRPDLALAESKQWVEAFSKAAEIVAAAPEVGRG